MSGSVTGADPALLAALVEARLHDPFALLGTFQVPGGDCVVRVFNPHAQAAWLGDEADGEPLLRVHPLGVFEWRGGNPPLQPCAVGFLEDGRARQTYDVYGFPPLLSAHDLYLFNEGRLTQAWHTLGSCEQVREGVAGTRFAVWAPNASRVSVVGDFNRWDGRVHPMASHGVSGVWELFLPGVGAGAYYKYEVRTRDGALLVKTDPYAQVFERRPGTAARVPVDLDHAWQDAAWLEARAGWDWLHAPLNIYEVHLGSWRRHPDGRFHSYRELVDELVPYVRDLGYTHVELLPITEHPLDESWGYQATGYFAATSRFGTAADLKALIDAFHQAGIGVFLDWVPAHFPADAFALARFDGSALYEHADPRLGMHQDWGTYIFNFGRHEVKSFLLSSARYWLDEFHVDGLRVDAVASMLYLDYSRAAGQWLPNRHGGRENLEAIDFLRQLNVLVHEQFPGALTLAEESTAWPMVSRPTWLGGLGFSLKWNMGWMNDSLSYFRLDPIYRRYSHDKLTFGQLYAYTENFLLPLSHDEVVHLKGSLLERMPGDVWQEFANLRLLLAWQAFSPGKKLSFMGNEFGHGREWNAGGELDWSLLQHAWHQGVQHLTRDLNRLHRERTALHELDFGPEGFRWIDCHDGDQSTLSFLRLARDGTFLVVLFNFTPVPRQNYRIGLPAGGRYREIFNSDSQHFGGSNLGNGGGIEAQPLPWMGLSHSTALTLPPLAALVLEYLP